MVFLQKISLPTHGFPITWQRLSDLIKLTNFYLQDPPLIGPIQSRVYKVLAIKCRLVAVFSDYKLIDQEDD